MTSRRQLRRRVAELEEDLRIAAEAAADDDAASGSPALRDAGRRIATLTRERDEWRRTAILNAARVGELNDRLARISGGGT